MNSDVLARLKATQCCDQAIDGMLGGAIEEIKKLRAALQPFADYDKYVIGPLESGDIGEPQAILLTDHQHGHKFAIRAKHFTTAREALEQPK